MSHHLALYLLGTPRIRLDSISVQIAGQKALALLAYLALTGVPHRRDALAGFFWPDYEQSSARTYLRQALRQLTQSLGHQWFDANRESIGLNGALPIEIDVEQFRRLAGGVANGVEELHEAVRLYTDDFLAGFSLPDCPEFDQWQLLETESLRRTLAEALQRLMHWHTTQQEFPQAIEFGYRWLALDPYHEPAHQALMQLYAWAGQRMAALRQYEECKRLLREAMQLVPDAETQKLHEMILGNRLVAPPAAQRAHQGETENTLALPAHGVQKPVPAVPGFLSTQEIVASAPFVFVERESELGALATALATARLGAGQVLFVIGGAGRGKTMLVQEFARRAQQDDAELLVASGRCNAYTGMGDPYLPFREILMELTGDVETKWAGGILSTEPARRLWEAMPLTLPALVEFSPDLIGTLVPAKGLLTRAATFAPPGAPWFQQLQEIAGMVQRLPLEERSLFSQVTETLKAIAAQRPLLLILEDLHWVDSASNSLLFHLSRMLWDSYILVVGTYRPDELTVARQKERHPLAGIVGELKRQYGDIWLDLGNLSPDEGRAFVDAYLDTQPNQLGPAFRAGLYRHTGGHALFTVELVRNLQERGELQRNDEGQWVVGESVNWSNLPAKVGGVIDQRIGRLEDELQAILATASVEGELFTAEVVARVHHIEDYTLVQRLTRELDRQHRLVVGEGLERVGQQRFSHYRFRHHLFQQYLYARLSQSERAYLHEAVGLAMEALYAGATDLIANQLAHHFEQAGLADKAVTYLRLAGTQAHRLSANHEAVHHLTRALTLLASLPTTPDRAHEELVLRITLGRALIALKGLGATEASEMYMRAYELCHQIGATHELFAVLHGLYSCQASFVMAHTIAQQMLQLAEKLPNPIYCVSAHHLIGNTLMFMGKFGPAQEHFEQSLALYDPRDHSDFLLLCGQDEGVACMANQCVNLWILGYADKALQRGQEAIELALSFSHPMSLSIAMHFVAYLHLLRGEVQAAHRQIDALLQLANEQGFSTLLILGHLYRSEALVRERKAEVAIAQTEKLLESLGNSGDRAMYPIPQVVLARAYGQIGQIEHGLANLSEAQRWVEARSQDLWQSELYRIKGTLLLAQADHQSGSSIDLLAAAEASFRQSLEVAHRQQAKLSELRAMISLCRLWQRQGKVEEARSALSELYGWFTEGFETADLVEAKRLLMELTTPGLTLG